MDELESRVVGSYRLATFHDIADDGEVRQPLGPDPVGFITYSAEHVITALLMAAGRPNFTDGDILAGSDADRVQAFASASAYAGRWNVEPGNANEPVIVHRLEAATFPNWVGSVQHRRFEIEADELRLFPPRLLMNGKMRRSELTWKRIAR